MIGFAFVYIGELDFLELLLVCVLRKPVETLRPERLGERAAPGGLLAVVGQLEVRVRRDRHGAAVTDLDRYANLVAVPRKRVDLFNDEAVPAFGREAQLE